jgi:predicted exporter
MRLMRTRVLLLWLASLAVAAALIWRTPFTADLSAFLPASPDARQQLLVEQLQSGVAARTLLIGIEGGSIEQRVAASRALAAVLRASPHIEQVQNGEDAGYSDIGRWLLAHRYLLSPAVTPERFTADGLRDAIDETLSLLGTPAGQAIKPLLERDPTGETLRIAEALLPASSPRSQDGVWVSRDGLRAVLLAGTHAAGADLDGQAAALDTVRNSFAALPQAGSLRLLLSGAPVFSVDSRSHIESEVKRLAIAGTVLASVVLLLAFASLRALGAALLPVGTGVVAGCATVGLLFGQVHGIALGFGATLIGEAVDYAIYYLIQARGGALRQTSEAGWRHWLRSSWPTVRLGLLTSVCGFSALALSGFPGLAQLGVFSSAGLVAAALTTRYVLPVLLPDGAPGLGLRRPLGAVMRAGLRLMPALRWPLLALGVAAAVLLVGQRDSLWRAELSTLSPIPADALALDASLRAELTSSDAGLLVVVSGDDLQQTLQRAEAAGQRLDELQNQQVLAGYNSATRWLPSAATQMARQAALPQPALLSDALTQATEGGPLPATRLQPFLDEVEAARAQPLVTLDTLQQTALSPLLEALLQARPDGSWRALMPVQGVGTPDEADASTLRTTLEARLQGLQGVQVLDIGPELGRLYDEYLRAAQWQTLLGAAGVALLMALWLRSWRRFLAVCQPLVLAVVLTLGGAALLGPPLGILHLVGLLLVVAVGSNYALFFNALAHSQGTEPAHADGDGETLASLLLANLTTVLSFALISTSSISALSTIGAVVAPGTLLALLLAMAFAHQAGEQPATDAPRGP